MYLHAGRSGEIIGLMKDNDYILGECGASMAIIPTRYVGHESNPANWNRQIINKREETSTGTVRLHLVS